MCQGPFKPNDAAVKAMAREAAARTVERSLVDGPSCERLSRRRTVKTGEENAAAAARRKAATKVLAKHMTNRPEKGPMHTPHDWKVRVCEGIAPVGPFVCALSAGHSLLHFAYCCALTTVVH